MNSTMKKFGYPETCIAESEKWCVVIRPNQITFGSMVFIYKDPRARSLADVDEQGWVNFSSFASLFEEVFEEDFSARKFNYLALMMVDPHVHFHVFPRYEDPVIYENIEFKDVSWPNPPELTLKLEIAQATAASLKKYLSERILHKAPASHFQISRKS